MGSKKLHPSQRRRHMSQSSNDTFPAAMHIARRPRKPLACLLPRSKTSTRRARRQSQGICRHRKNRPHSFAGRHRPSLSAGIFRLRQSSSTAMAAASPCALDGLYDLAIGGTAVGTGLNAHPEFGRTRREENRRTHRTSLRSHPNKFAALIRA